MHRVGAVGCSLDDVLRCGHRVGRAMNNQQELVGLHSSFIVDHAILRDADTYQSCSERTDASDDGSFEACYDRGPSELSWI
jgi:hypothetical protein